MLSEKEIERYSRHILLGEIGMAGQEKLKNARVLVVGAGGLGCPVLQYLTAAGVGTIGIVDFDKVDISNLQRQILYSVEDIGKQKASIAAQKLSAQNPLVKFNVHNVELSNQNALEIFSQYDIIVDGSDNFATRYLVNDACVLLNKPLVYGSIYKFEGQLSVFNYQNGPTYRCVFPAPPLPGEVLNCAETGVLGVLPGIIGSLQANECIKIITGIGETLSGKLLLMDALSMHFSKLEIKRTEAGVKASPSSAEAFLKTDYAFFCGTSENKKVKSVSVKEVLEMMQSQKPIQLLDVREPGEEPQLKELNDLQIPLSLIDKQSSKIARNKKVIVFCKSGNRSKRAIQQLEKEGFDNLYNLEGGVMEWLRKSS